MKTFLEPEKAIKHIFSTQYLTDELGADWTKDIPEMAMLSAQKLYSYVGGDQSKKLRSLLQEMHDNYEHPLVIDAEFSAWVDWEDEPEQWSDFQKLLDEIIKNIPS
jgi:type I restriction-modification system DNA methylase subunit